MTIQTYIKNMNPGRATFNHENLDIKAAETNKKQNLSTSHHADMSTKRRDERLTLLDDGDQISSMTLS